VEEKEGFLSGKRKRSSTEKRVYFGSGERGEERCSAKKRVLAGASQSKKGRILHREKW